MLSAHFNVDYDEVDPLLPGGEFHSMTSTEKDVLKGLVNYSNSSDKDVAEKSGSSRQTVSRLRKEFEQKRVMKTINVVDYPGLGYQLYYFFKLKCVPALHGTTAEAILDDIFGYDAFLAGHTNTEVIMAGFCYDFRELNEKHRQIKKTLENASISPNDWDFEIMTTDSVRFLIRHNYGQLMPFL